MAGRTPVCRRVGARISTTDQDLSIQKAALKAAGWRSCAEKRSGTTTKGRDELKTILDFLREGDVLMVTRIDRLARSIGDLQDIVRAVRAAGASLGATEQPIDTEHGRRQVLPRHARGVRRI